MKGDLGPPALKTRSLTWEGLGSLTGVALLSRQSRRERRSTCDPRRGVVKKKLIFTWHNTNILILKKIKSEQEEEEEENTEKVNK